MDSEFVIKGNILYMTSLHDLTVVSNGYLVVKNGICQGVFETLPKQYVQFPVKDYGDRLVIPGMVDLHLHAPQYAFRGLGMDMELLDWLNVHAFPEEAKYCDLEYAGTAYNMFVQDLRKSATTRACIFATRHKEATLLLMKLLEESGLITYVGKVNMDRNSNELLQEKSADESVRQTESIIEQTTDLERTKPILTPRFIPTCSDELMEKLSGLQKKYQLPVQSHLSENESEIEWVRELNPKAAFYGDAYDMFGLFGAGCPTVMAHCVHSQEEEIQRMKQNGVYVAHCPSSNTGLASGIAPVRRYLEEGIHVGLGTDIAGGYSLSLFRIIVETINVSKLYWRLVDDTKSPVTSKEAFYLATLGGGQFFGRVGSFMEGYEADILVLDDSKIGHPQELTLEERLERLFYLATDEVIVAKYVKGRLLFES